MQNNILGGDNYMYGAIDIGSNSVRLLIATKEAERIIPVYQDLKTTRLGEGITKTGEVSNDAILRTIEALKLFKEIINTYDIKEVKAVATSAVRESANASSIIATIFAETRLKVDVITGEKEAELSYLGACTDLKTQKNRVVIDIGGGSTELIYKKENKLVLASSPLGAVKCTENATTPSQIFAILEKHLTQLRSLVNYQLIAVGGTATTLVAVVKKLAVYNPDLVHGSQISIEELGETIFYIAGKSLAERIKIPGLQPERADIIVAGLLILWVIMTYLDKGFVTISEKDLLYGIVKSMA